MLRPALWTALLMAFLAIYTNAAAQLQENPGLASDSVRISLLTVLPGNDVYSLWGHSAIRVTVPSQGIDVSYNYGTFDFEADWFVPKFMYGSLLYRLSRHDYELAAHSYREIEERPMIEQVLNLSPAQEGSLIRFLENNYLPENRLYTYDFVYDNCSTRIRDALERSLGEAVRFADRPDPQLTFRDLLDPYHREWPFLDAGIDWLLGAPVDRMARPHETMFCRSTSWLRSSMRPSKLTASAHPSWPPPTRCSGSTATNAPIAFGGKSWWDGSCSASAPFSPSAPPGEAGACSASSIPRYS